MLGRRAVFAGVLLAAPLWVAEVRAACGPADLEPAVVQQVSATGDIGLADGRRLRTAGLHLGPVDPASWPRPGDRIAVGILGEAKDRWSRLAALVFTFQADGSLAWLQQRLIANGGALLQVCNDAGKQLGFIRPTVGYHGHHKLGEVAKRLV